jgi:3-carboxy-cis,cis-muconate cycloisomerase
MTDLFWPGDERAEDHFTSASFLHAMTEVERVWLGVLGFDPGQGFPAPAVAELDVESGGNAVVGLVAHLRKHLDGEVARWVHRGLTSQDVVDTALMVLARDAAHAVRRDLRAQIGLLADLADRHRASGMVARTLTQHAVPTTFGLKAAGWLGGLLDADDDLARLRFPVQLGGAAGTLAAVVELGLDPDGAGARLARGLGLEPAAPWHTSRAPITRLADAAVHCTDAWGRIANDVLTLSRPEIGELAEGAGGGSSTMPHKQNPVLSALLHSAALTTPQLAATLHLAAAQVVDERAAGAWHAEWSTVATLLRRTVVAGSQATDLLVGLRVDTDRMRTTLEAAAESVRSEQRSMNELTGREPSAGYLGAAEAQVDATLDRARAMLKSEGAP